jgi:altered-inheritance-of-mitochondria protein 5
MKDLLKHHWNQEVEKLAKKAYDSRWEDARDTAMEGWKTVVRLVKKE